MNNVVLVYQEDKGVQKHICTFLNEKGYSAVGGNTEEDLATLADEIMPDVVITDIPGVSEAIKIREQLFVPFIVVSSVATEKVKVRMLDRGAEDYIVRPFMKEEFLARLRVVLRRKEGPKKYFVNGLAIDFKKRSITRDGQKISLTPIEFRIVELLCRQPGCVLTHDYILKQIWGPYVHGDNKILRVNITNIRKKLEPEPSKPIFIVTVNGIGYRMSDNISE